MRIIREAEFAKRLQMLRERMKRKQTELARELGVSRGRFNNWERGLTRPNAEQMHKLALFFGVQVRWLQHGDDDLIDKRIDKVMQLMRHAVRELEHIHRALRAGDRSVTRGLTRREARNKNKPADETEKRP